MLEIPINIESNEEAASPECEFIPRSLPKQEAGDADEKKVIVIIIILCTCVLCGYDEYSQWGIGIP